jgi:hypothetical protein
MTTAEGGCYIINAEQGGVIYDRAKCVFAGGEKIARQINGIKGDLKKEAA